jgi:Fe2+ transport system protein B
MWPTYVMHVGKVNDEGISLDTTINTRLFSVCGLATRQRVSLTMQGCDELTENKKDELFKNSIQAYVQYPKELKKKGKKVAMKIISHAWRSYNSKLVKIWRDQDTPFDKYKDLPKEDCVRFVEKCESENFAMNSQYMQWLRSQNELDHHLSNTGYAEKQRKWQQEDERLAQQGLENPYHKFCGSVGPFMRAHSKLTESGDVSFCS